MRLLTGREVANILGLSTRGVRWLDDELQPIRIGKVRGYDPEHIERVRQRRERERQERQRQRRERGGRP